MLHSCTHMATVAVEGLIDYVSFCIAVDGSVCDLLLSCFE